MIGKTQEVDVEIRDIQETTTTDEVKETLKKVIDNDLVVAVNAVKSLRRAYGETQIALVRLPAEVAWKVIGERGKIRIGLVNCSIREISLEMEEFTDLIDRLVKDARERSPVVIAGDFNAWATDWGRKWTNRRGKATGCDGLP